MIGQFKVTIFAPDFEVFPCGLNIYDREIVELRLSDEETDRLIEEMVDAGDDRGMSRQGEIEFWPLDPELDALYMLATGSVMPMKPQGGAPCIRLSSSS